MTKRLTTLTPVFLFLFSWMNLYSQDYPLPDGSALPSLSAQDQFLLSRIPELVLPDFYKGLKAITLPYMVDNSTQPYFRPITWQSGFECGQSAGIAFNFTYEVDRLRNLPANVGDNQYPTHFAWDFLNEGDNYHGASCLDSWEIVKACGTMNVTDYGGGLNTGGYLRWISGYDKYYNGMANRLNYERTIRVGTPEGLQTLKYWLYDHLEGSPVGGVANFYAQYCTPTDVLPSGTPEAGKFVIAHWGSNPSHTWTICGYNDSIRFDYNGDGLYTNNLDINNDGVVDMHDWEIGGIKFASGYAGTGWANGGFCYMMYKTLADDIGYGGLWDHSAFIIDVKQACAPKLTMKVTLKHTSRNKLKITAGLSTDLGATAPSQVLEFPIFKFQGADHYMQGGTTEADKTIEFGLDVTPLLNHILPGQAAKYFLQVQENDPGNSAPGEIVNWSLLDYTGATPVEISYPTSNVPISNNTTTILGIEHSVNFIPPQITTTSIPPANLYQFFNTQLQATNGTTPYLWDAKITYPQATSSAIFPSITDEQLVPNTSTGFAVKELPFEFPFYNRFINKIYIHRSGYVVFEDMKFTWPFLCDQWLLFRETPNISLFYGTLTLYSGQGDGIWYKAEASSVTIRWKASITGMQGTTSLNFALKIYPDGKIEFYYGNMVYPASTFWTSGISSGDNTNYQKSLFAGNPAIPSNSLETFSASGYPAEMKVTEDGYFTGTPKHPYQNLPVVFRVKDQDNLTSEKTLLFSTNGLLINYSLNSGGDSILEFGETANVNLTIHNIGNQTVYNINTWMHGSNNYITLIDSSQYIGNMNPGQIITVNNAYSFSISPSVPDQFSFPLYLHVSSVEHNFIDTLAMEAFAPVIKPVSVILLDGDNGKLDPGETTDVLITFRNQGSAAASGTNVLLSSTDTMLTVNNGTASLGTMAPDSSGSAVFNISGSPDAPFQHLYRINSNITANNGFNTNDSILLFSGEIIEDYETGDFSKFPWQFGLHAPWTINNTDQHEGMYCAKSGWIVDNQESGLFMSVKVLASGPISFWKKVSCENDPNGTNYDYLAFFIDNTEMGRWDGQIAWSQETFNVTSGYHIFKWIYHKDYSVSTGSDAAWIDFISFPLFEGALPVLNVTPQLIEESLYQGHDTTRYLTISNSGGNFLDYLVLVYDTTANKKLNKKSSPFSITGSYLECFSSGFVPGEDFSWTFMVHNAGTDNENINHLKMDFPPGVIVSTATNFTGGSLGELVFQGGSGNGASLNWHGATADDKGVIRPGETATATIDGTVTEAYMDNAFIVYMIRGDSNGTGVHAVPGDIFLQNYGIPNTWVGLEGISGTLPTGGFALTTVNLTTQNLSVGEHTCNVVVKDPYNNKIIVPVILHVLDTTTIGLNDLEKNRVWCYPNPFNTRTCIQYAAEGSGNYSIEIFDMTGNRVKNLTGLIPGGGVHSVFWDGRNELGEVLPPGIYNCRLKTDKYTGITRLVLIH